VSNTDRATLINNNTTLIGTVYNLFLYDGTNVDGAIAYMQEELFTTNLVSAGTTDTFIDFIGGMYRIHEVQDVFDGSLPSNTSGCQMVSTDDEIGCLVQADPCSIGIAGNGATTWNSNPQDSNGTGIALSGSVTNAVRVNGMYPNATTVQALGAQAPSGILADGGADGGSVQEEYPIARKLYLNSVIGFDTVFNEGADAGAGSGNDPNTVDELILAQQLSGTFGSLNTTLATFSLFSIGSNPAGANASFCEDFNEKLVCGASSNVQNACGTNPTGIARETTTTITAGRAPANSTICGDGVIEVFEECDPGIASQASTCSSSCRCSGVNVFKGNSSTPCAAF